MPKHTTNNTHVMANSANGNYINRKVQNAVAGVGGMIGGAINAVGNGVTNAGRGAGNTINNTTRYWGQGVAGYGNDIKDRVHASGPRVATAGNPLGLSGVGQAKGMLPGNKLPASTAQSRNTGKGSAKNPLGL
ncbi:hypothetical protein H2203_004353 [Taxawa tesnikishii (nom. ined.)]|nr:hypothetical protein H2203_004353 [Dothideales sp. JES 119]